MSERQAGEMKRRRARPCPAAPATLPDDDDILSEILLRLPPRPSSLPRASLVCKRWRRLVAEPHFRRRFRARHRNPPLVGVFEDDGFFGSVMDPPDLIPAERFSLRLGDDASHRKSGLWANFGCRHGRVLLCNQSLKEIVVWDPQTRDQRRLAVPPELDNKEKIICNGGVLCAAVGHSSHVHGGFSSCPFKVALVGVTRTYTQMFACIYSSETSKWSDLVSTAVPFSVYFVNDPGTLVGNALYWMPLGKRYGIVEFDLGRHSLAVIEWPSGAKYSGLGSSRLVLGEDGGLGLAVLSCHSLQTWERRVYSEGVAKWVLRKTDKLHKVHGMRSGMEVILGYADDINVMLLWIDSSVYMLQLVSLKSTKLWETNIIYQSHPYACIYDSGI